MKKHYKLTPEERVRHEMAVKIRKMTDSQLCDFIEEIQNSTRSVDDFLSRLDNMPRTGNGIGPAELA